MFKPCVLIPVFNHEHAIGSVVEEVLAHNVPCVLVDDGSSAECAEVLDAIAAANASRVALIRHSANQGKGAAIQTGVRHAAENGYTHLLQVDADGQHNINDIQPFLQKSRENPSAIIAGHPVYDESVPLVRFYGRYMTHIWVWINTLSLQIKDSMCGFRVYPVKPTLALIERRKLGPRMTFDTEVIVRLHWNGVKVLNLPTEVRYPLDGVSHFRPLADNVQISWMHTTLFFGMLIRLPKLLWSKWARK